MHYRANGCPCLIGEVVSDRIKEEDRFRMLAQGIAAARAGSVLIKNSEFVLMAIYVSADLVATRYFLQVNSDGRVRLRSVSHSTKPCLTDGFRASI